MHLIIKCLIIKISTVPHKCFTRDLLCLLLFSSGCYNLDMVNSGFLDKCCLLKICRPPPPLLLATQYLNLIYFCVYVGLDKIENLQAHENREIYQKTFDIIEKYFGMDDDDAQLLPAVS